MIGLIEALNQTASHSYTGSPVFLVISTYSNDKILSTLYSNTVAKLEDSTSKSLDVGSCEASGFHLREFIFNLLSKRRDFLKYPKIKTFRLYGNAFFSCV